jgi:hypothetical protein
LVWYWLVWYWLVWYWLDSLLCHSQLELRLSWAVTKNACLQACFNSEVEAKAIFGKQKVDKYKFSLLIVLHLPSFGKTGQTSTKYFVGKGKYTIIKQWSFIIKLLHYSQPSMRM